MRCWKDRGFGRWHDGGADRMQSARERWCGGQRGGRSSGNSAFDEYRNETLRRLEDEQREFLEFLQRLRQAKDKAEFDQFIAEHGHRPEGPQSQPSA